MHEKYRPQCDPAHIPVRKTVNRELAFFGLAETKLQKRRIAHDN